VVEEIIGKEAVEGVRTRNALTQEKGTVPCQGVFIFIGNAPNTGFIGDALPLCMGGHICTNEHMATVIEGVYAVGDIRGNSYRQIATAVGEGCIAAIAISHWLQEQRAKAREKAANPGRRKLKKEGVSQ
jgi:thioredoxin reductase (NADPH)